MAPPFSKSMSAKLIQIKRIGRQVVREFWFPFIGAMLWTAYNVLTGSHERTFASVVNIFLPSFFLLSWLLGQLFRIGKQQKVESSLGQIHHAVNSTISQLEGATNKMLDTMTGGEGVCYLTPIKSIDGPNVAVAVVHGKFALFNISGHVVDLDEHQAALMEGRYPGSNHRQFAIPMLPIDYGHPVANAFVRGPKRVQVQFYARNGMWIQDLRFAYNERTFSFATRVHRNGVVAYEHIDADFPCNDGGGIDWDAA